MQGLGLFTMEELKFSPSGLLYTRGPSQYKIPAVCDVPLQFNVNLLPDSENPHAIYSSKVRPLFPLILVILFGFFSGVSFDAKKERISQYHL